jgi:hypothetical protein
VFETKKAAGQRLRSRLKWNRVGNIALKEFYRATKERSGTSQITELEDSAGAHKTNQKGLEEVCVQYYSELYTAAPQTAAKGGAEAQAFACIGDRLSCAMKEALKRPMSLSELTTVVMGMK